MTNSKKLRVSDSARADLQQIGDYTEREWGTAQKKKYLSQIKHKFKVLQHQTGLGHACAEIDKNLYACPVEKHTIFYRVTENNLEIVRVLHGSMDVKPLLDVGDQVSSFA